jgi:hypothetical protein
VHLDKSSPGSDVSDMEHKEMVEEDGQFGHQGGNIVKSLPHIGILQSSSTLDKVECRGPLLTPPGTGADNGTIPSGNKKRTSIVLLPPERPELGSPRSTKSKVSFTGSEGTGHRSITALNGGGGEKVGAPTQYQVSDGVKEYSSRLYTSDNTKTGCKRSSKRW